MIIQVHSTFIEDLDNRIIGKGDLPELKQHGNALKAFVNLMDFGKLMLQPVDYVRRTRLSIAFVPGHRMIM